MYSVECSGSCEWLVYPECGLGERERPQWAIWRSKCRESVEDQHQHHHQYLWLWHVILWYCYRHINIAHTTTSQPWEKESEYLSSTETGTGIICLTQVGGSLITLLYVLTGLTGLTYHFLNLSSHLRPRGNVGPRQQGVSHCWGLPCLGWSSPVAQAGVSDWITGAGAAWLTDLMSRSAQPAPSGSQEQQSGQ